uniref:Uncharacterized protein n=1 Tax=viral metagenome TaxID=1070528 RepID=A0A6C0LGW0_9ZZZZ
MIKSEQQNENNEQNENSNNLVRVSKFSILTSIFSSSFNLPIVIKSINGFLGIMSIGQIIFGIISWFVNDKITSIGYVTSGIFSGTTLTLLCKMRLLKTMQQSVNVLKEENDELKENNEELKENIDDLESVSNKLSEDLKMLKETIGLLDQNADDIIENLREIYTSLKKENEIHSKLNKNMIHINILQIIRHFDTSTTFSLKLEDLNKAKKTLLNSFPNLNYNLLLTKIKENNKITAKNIYESIKTQKE